LTAFLLVAFHNLAFQIIAFGFCLKKIDIPVNKKVTLITLTIYLSWGITTTPQLTAPGVPPSCLGN